MRKLLFKIHQQSTACMFFQIIFDLDIHHFIYKENLKHMALVISTVTIREGVHKLIFPRKLSIGNHSFENSLVNVLRYIQFPRHHNGVSYLIGVHLQGYFVILLPQKMAAPSIPRVILVVLIFLEDRCVGL